MNNFGQNIKAYIDNNRRGGTTTALVRAALANDATIVVASHENKTKILYHLSSYLGYDINQEEAKKLKIITIYQLDKEIGKTKGPIFFDTDVISIMATRISNEVNLDGYYQFSQDANLNKECKEQFNIKLAKDDIEQIDEINADFFEKEASHSMLGRILIRKGIQWYKSLKQ